jgi:carbamate kinase
MPRTAVVAIGGNALVRPDQSGTHAEQAANAMEMAHAVYRLRRAGWNVALVHGNGPQVGNLAIQQDAAVDEVPPQPLFSVNAMTQGQLGSLLCLALHEAAREDRPDIAALVTHVVVHRDDPAFADPTKPVGPFFGGDRAQAMAAEHGWAVAEDAGRGFRRVVASPRPVEVVEAAAIRTLVEAGTLVIAAGGGGVPVVATEHGYRQVDAVIDKDYAAQQLATALGAGALVMVTAVPHVLLDFGTDHERAVTEMTTTEADRRLAAGEFAEGSMAPKIRAAVNFVQAGEQTAVITSPERVVNSLESSLVAKGRGGTRIVATPTGTEALWCSTT